MHSSLDAARGRQGPMWLKHSTAWLRTLVLQLINCDMRCSALKPLPRLLYTYNHLHWKLLQPLTLKPTARPACSKRLDRRGQLDSRQSRVYRLSRCSPHAFVYICNSQGGSRPLACKVHERRANALLSTHWHHL